MAKKKVRRATHARRTQRRKNYVVRSWNSGPSQKGTVHAGNRGPRYALNPEFSFLSELGALILKSSREEREEMIKDISRLGRIRLAVASGVFLNTKDVRNESAFADLFIVGDDIDRRRLTQFLRNLEADIGQEIKLGVMDREEFEYRYTMFDRFVRMLLEGPHEKLINKLGI